MKSVGFSVYGIPTMLSIWRTMACIVYSTVGKKAAEGIVEYKMRRDIEKSELGVAEAIEKAVNLVREESRGGTCG